jgi:hypothetical protein
MDTTRRSPYEVRDGRLLMDGAAVPLAKGLILLALAKAGWNGAEGRLDAALARRLFAADPRIAVALPTRARAG